MTESQLHQRLQCWTGERSTEYRAVLNDLALLKLQKGDVPEAQKLFQEALVVNSEASQDIESSEAAEEDWESSWESSLNQLQQKQQAAHLKPARTKSKAPAANKQPRRLLSNSKLTDNEESMAEVPFGGNHALECPSMSQHATVLKLESFLAQQHWSSIAPVVRPVTDTHAVVVCANPADARALLQHGKQGPAAWRFKAFSEACQQCQALSAAELQPPQPRQKTTTAVARRLIGHALNVSGVHDKEAEQQLKAQRAASKAAQVEKQRQLEATWDDD